MHEVFCNIEDSLLMVLSNFIDSYWARTQEIHKDCVWGVPEPGLKLRFWVNVRRCRPQERKLPTGK